MQRKTLAASFAILLAGSLSFALDARAETPAPKPDAPLSKKLDDSKGVIKPPHGVDPEIHKDPPAATGDKMPVIIPPGEPGGNQSIQPK